MLTRRQMLRFISVTPKDRASQIQALLNLKHIEAVRSNLVSVRNTLKRKKDDANLAQETSKSDVSSVLGLERFDNNTLLQSINENRAILGLAPLEKTCSSEVDKDIRPRGSTLEQPLSLSLLREQVENVIGIVSSSNLQRIRDTDSQLRTALEGVRKNPGLLRTLSQQELLHTWTQTSRRRRLPALRPNMGSR